MREPAKTAYVQTPEEECQDAIWASLLKYAKTIHGEKLFSEEMTNDSISDSIDSLMSVVVEYFDWEADLK